jgi:hypothetical protein
MLTAQATVKTKTAVTIDLITAIIETLIELLELLSIIRVIERNEVAWRLASLLVYSKT